MSRVWLLVRTFGARLFLTTWMEADERGPGSGIESKSLIQRSEGQIPEMATILNKQEVELLLHTRALLEEILETLEISTDPRTSKALREGLKDLRAGRVRPYREFTKELRGSHEL